MASVRKLKKDIDYLSMEIITYCFHYLDTHAEAKTEDAIAIVEKIIDLRNNLINRCNHPDGKDNPKLIKKHYQAIVADFGKGCGEAYDKLEELLDIKSE
ncbi:hypothetical protein EYV94_17025 [Puteibacter caeruleilacunae]|nr:hypothetical protein EYV94_17025 [Puteibacter caeruleilacunae]